MALYQKTGNTFSMKDELKGHDKTVTGIDIAPNSGRIVTCSQGEGGLYPSDIKSRALIPWLPQIEMPTFGSPLPLVGSPPSCCFGLTVPQPLSAGRHQRRSSQLGPEHGLSPFVTSKRRMIGGYRNI